MTDTSIDMMGMSNHHTAQKGDGFFCLPETYMLWSEMCKLTPGQESKILLKNEAVTRCHHPQYSVSCNDMGQEEGRGKKHIKPDSSLQMHNYKDLLVLRYVVWSDETKVKLFGHKDHCCICRKKWHQGTPA